ncbi:AgrD family cyclic lactone autoinducer peptide [Listeria booriae]|uniref:Cyclic lactone autoinducer peptide n=1 Tax=Listeria booriae TaxID=1552123 RepID=A0A7X1CCR9_9LIST|nr:cyclic lactone autoinducer peptide [Listeria booriae]MBC1285766.1 cyclic lactone autoinducer peptide [Listeria booriae]MBC1492649.1 cyclic lactone autoinducer peptide [Listeria booriae]MBC1511361.1 cyclic lactone autoinducer peptide [Listeria booriae]MBC1574752.1 cyclic lactone autoinducer peptide [Listeria booriae]MBC1892016.1 cyclic lactone autoinducer peptide [Listeria booriae]
MKNIKELWEVSLDKVVKNAEEQFSHLAEESTRKSCFGVLYEPKVPQVLLKDTK